MAKSDDADAGFVDDKEKEDATSMAERLRIRSRKKPSYHEVELEDEVDWEDQEGEARNVEIQPSKILRTNTSDDSCHACGGSGKLLCCDTCTAVYHLECLRPPLKVVPRGKWSCPQCINPLADFDKILDSQMRLSNTGNNEASSTGPSNQKLVKQYLVKWKSRSYLHCSWISQAELETAFKAYPRLKTKVNNFHRQMNSMNTLEDDWLPIRPEWTTVDRIINCRMTGDVREYLVKWKELAYDQCSWEVEEDVSAFQAQINRFNAINARGQANTSQKRKGSAVDGREAKCQRKDFKPYDGTPKFLVGGTLHPYQLEGLNFLRFAWLQGTHVILADEMGLGKTVQCISLLASLAEGNVSVPHLVVAPLSTLRNWEREFSTWAPQMNVVMYVGTAQSRSVIRQYEFFFPKKCKPSKKHKGKKKPLTELKQSKQDRIKFDVLLTSYEMITLDTAILKAIKWECLIVDEGHRLKNKDSKLFQTLKQFSSKHRVLLTGTPLQNNLDELFMLMHFLDCGKFASLEDFQQEFKDISQEEQVGRLHQMLAPHLLRRVKKDVMKDLPPKKELILRVELSSTQKEYYKAILTRNYQILARRGGPQISLNNVVMELRKLCGHPYMLEGVEPNEKNMQDSYRQLLEASGKLLLLDKMMVKLKAQGHRVLIYSQFQHMLDILEDYVSYKKWAYERIDGKISGVERQIRIDRFNAPNSTRFCFLLSTRAGGLGINLATADTVIIYDSDWNPHADLQAMARAHRLGQTSKVMIYRLVTRGTIEERMMQMTKKKMILEHLVVGRLKTQVLNQEELDDILRHGAKELFSNENDEAGKARQIHYDDAAIDRLLDRFQADSEDAVADEDEENGFLKTFKVANFEYVDEEEAASVRYKEIRKQEEVDHQSADVGAAEKAKYWDDLLKSNYEQQQIETFSELGKGRRCRKQIMSTEEDDLAGLDDVSSEDEDEGHESEWVETDDSSLSKGLPDTAGRKSQAPRKKARVETAETLEPSLLEGEGKSLRVLGFNQKQRATFVQILMRFGLGDFSWSEFIPRLKQKTIEEIKDYGTLFLTHIAEDITDSQTFSDGVPKEGLRIQDVLVRLAILHLIRDKMEFLAKTFGAPLFTSDIKCKFPGLKYSGFWKEEHDQKLLQAILKHGYGRWQAVVEDREAGFQEVIRKELQLPIVTSSTIKGLQAQDCGLFPATEIKGPSAEGDGYNCMVAGQVRLSIAGHACDVAGEAGEEPAPGSERKKRLNEDGPLCSESEPSPLKDLQVQKRMVEFLKRRMLLLERALNAEYHKESTEGQNGCVDINEEPRVLDSPTFGNQAQPLLLLIAPEEMLTFAFDNELNRLGLARLYNEMCRVVNENEHDAFQTYSGNKSAGFRLRKNLRLLDSLCQEVCRILVLQRSPDLTPAAFKMDLNQSAIQNADNVNGEDADAQSDDLKDDLDLGVEGDSDSEHHLENSKLPSSLSDASDNTVTSTPQTTPIIGQICQAGQQAFGDPNLSAQK